MIRNSHHIISSLRWDTTLDSKEQSFELQEKLSSWSKIGLQREFTDVFNKICPKDQIWRMDTLEINLGEIDFDDLDSELSFKLVRKLKEKLVEQILYSYRKDSAITIINGDLSQLALIKDFLLSGFMPWTFKSEFGSVNDIVTQQLNVNVKDLIGLLRDVGAKHENVRKRIAWQFEEKNVKRIIKYLEPANHIQIFSFTEDIIQIQLKENIVQSSSSDFKRNMWFWIFNHILVERGTLFNKVVFVKSSIQQMASHHNVSYNDLIQLIRLSVSRIVNKRNRQDELINVLRIISANVESKNANYEFAFKNIDDYWEIIESFLVTAKINLNDLTYDEINEVFQRLAQVDSKKMRFLIKRIGTDSNHWSALLTKLNTKSVKSILYLLSQKQSDNVFEDIESFGLITKNSVLKVDRKALMVLCISFLIEKGQLNYITEFLLEHFVKHFSEEKKMKYDEILDRLTDSSKPFSKGSVSVLRVYNGLHSLLRKESEKDKFHFSYFEKSASIKSNVTLQNANDDLFYRRNYFSKHIRLNPEKLFGKLGSIKDRLELESLLTSVISQRDLVLLCPYLKEEQNLFIRLFKESITHLKVSPDLKDKILRLNSRLVNWVMEFAFLNPDKDRLFFYKHILVKSICFLGQESFKEFCFLLEDILKSGFSNYKIHMEELRSLVKSVSGLKLNSPKERIFYLIKNSRANALDVIEVLNISYHDKEIKQLLDRGGRDAELVLNYLMSDGVAIRKQLFKVCYEFLQHEKIIIPDFEYFFFTEYWKSILSNANFLKDIEAFKADVYFRISSYYPEFYPILLSNLSGNEKVKQIRPNKEKGNGKGKFKTALEAFLLDDKEKRLSDVSDNKLREWILLVLRADPDFLKQLITSESLENHKKLKVFSSIDPMELVFELLKTTSGDLKRAIESLIYFNFLLTHFNISTDEVRYRERYFEFLRILLKYPQKSIVFMKEFSNEILLELQNEKGITMKEIAERIETDRLKIPATLNTFFQQEKTMYPEAVQTKVPLNLSDILNEINSNEMMDNLCRHLIMKNEVPEWFLKRFSVGYKNLLKGVMELYPTNFLLVLRERSISSDRIKQLQKSIDFNVFVNALRVLNSGQNHVLQTSQDLYFCFEKVTLGLISFEEIQEIIFYKLYKAWQSGNWRLVSANSIWKELFWEIGMLKGINAETIVKEFEVVKYIIPLALQPAFDNLSESNKRAVVLEEEPEEILEKVEIKKIELPKIKEGIHVYNAGVVLLSSYIPLLYERLSILKDKVFADQRLQRKAIHYLQYVITGLTKTEENLLPLNKVLCGMELSEPVEGSIQLLDTEIKLIEGLINAAISHWPSVGDTSIEGFRGNWLVRKGLLLEQDDKWELIIEKKAYDILIHQSPYSFSIIRYPWMKKPLYVTWPY